MFDLNLDIIVAVTAVFALLISLYNLRMTAHANKIASETTEAAVSAIKQSDMIKLFGQFDIASQMSVANPELLYDVHGLDRKKISMKEARAIAYLSALIDGFQHYYGNTDNTGYEELSNEVIGNSNFLNRILAVQANQRRWQIMKNIYYGEYDRDFIQAIDRIIEHENRKSDSAS